MNQEPEDLVQKYMHDMNFDDTELFIVCDYIRGKDFRAAMRAIDDASWTASHVTGHDAPEPLFLTGLREHIWDRYVEQELGNILLGLGSGEPLMHGIAKDSLHHLFEGAEKYGKTLPEKYYKIAQPIYRKAVRKDLNAARSGIKAGNFDVAALTLQHIAKQAKSAGYKMPAEVHRLRNAIKTAGHNPDYKRPESDLDYLDDDDDDFD